MEDVIKRYFSTTNLALVNKLYYEHSFINQIKNNKIKWIDWVIPPGGYPKNVIIKNKREIMIWPINELRKLQKYEKRLGDVKIYGYTSPQFLLLSGSNINYLTR